MARYIERINSCFIRVIRREISTAKLERRKVFHNFDKDWNWGSASKDKRRGDLTNGGDWLHRFENIKRGFSPSIHVQVENKTATAFKSLMENDWFSLELKTNIIGNFYDRYFRIILEYGMTFYDDTYTVKKLDKKLFRIIIWKLFWNWRRLRDGQVESYCVVLCPMCSMVLYQHWEWCWKIKHISVYNR